MRARLFTMRAYGLPGRVQILPNQNLRIKLRSSLEVKTLLHVTKKEALMLGRNQHSIIMIRFDLRRVRQVFFFFRYQDCALRESYQMCDIGLCRGASTRAEEKFWSFKSVYCSPRQLKAFNGRVAQKAIWLLDHLDRSKYLPLGPKFGSIEVNSQPVEMAICVILVDGIEVHDYVDHSCSTESIHGNGPSKTTTWLESLWVSSAILADTLDPSSQNFHTGSKFDWFWIRERST